MQLLGNIGSNLASGVIRVTFTTSVSLFTRVLVKGTMELDGMGTWVDNNVVIEDS